MNFDETGLYYQMPPHKAMYGLKKKSKNRLTVGLLCNASDTYKGHPIVIGKSKELNCFKTETTSKENSLTFDLIISFTNISLNNDYIFCYIKVRKYTYI